MDYSHHNYYLTRQKSERIPDELSLGGYSRKTTHMPKHTIVSYICMYAGHISFTFFLCGL